MMDFITGLDTGLLMLVNTAWTAPFLDPVMVYITLKMNFIGVMITGAALVWILGKRRDFKGLVLLPAAVITGELASGALKLVFMRVRPCRALEGVRLLVDCPSSFSLPSGHATVAFAAMVFLSARHPRLWPLFLAFAALIAYSRPYVGVHYPSDIAAGALLGTLIALIFISAEKRFLAGWGLAGKGSDGSRDGDNGEEKVF